MIEVKQKEMRIPKNRPPAHPGEILLLDFLQPMGLTQRQLADAIHVPYQRINELVNGKRGVTSSTALRLSKFFDNSSEFWLNLKQSWDLYHVLKQEAEDINKILRFKGFEDGRSASINKIELSQHRALKRRGFRLRVGGVIESHFYFAAICLPYSLGITTPRAALRTYRARL